MNPIDPMSARFGGLAALSSATTRSISPENPTGAPGAGGRATEGTGAHRARELGPGWKVSPSVEIGSGQTHTLADIDGSGVITHLWMTTRPLDWRSLVLRAYWDGEASPAIEVPLGDFFGQGWCRFAQLSSSTVAVNPNGGLNSYWPMPFATGARLTLENRSAEPTTVYYQLTWESGHDLTGTGYLHAQFHRSNPVPRGSLHPVVEHVVGHGKYVGCYVAWGVNSPGWWGEGELKVFLDGDDEFPSICGTGTEDYFGGAWNFDVPELGGYTPFTTPYLGMHQVLAPDGLYNSQQRFGMYRWHVVDPIHFQQDLRIDLQALGFTSDQRYRQRTDDVASTALYYLDRPAGSTEVVLPDHDDLEVTRVFRVP